MLFVTWEARPRTAVISDAKNLRSWCLSARQNQTLAYAGASSFVYAEVLPVVQTPRIPMPPAFEEGWKMQDEQPVTRELYDTMVQMLKVINEAVDTLPALKPMP